MAKIWALRLIPFVCVASLLSSAAFGQSKSSPFWLSPTECNFALELNSAKLSSAEKVCYFRNQMFGRSAYLTVSLWSGVAMLKQQTAPHVGDGDAFAEQLGLRYTRVLAKNTAEYLAGSFRGEDPRFRSSLVPSQNCKSTASTARNDRLLHALVRVVWTENDDTCNHELSYGRLAGAFSSSLMERAWLPEGQANWERTMRSSSVSLGTYAIRSIWAEFAPDVKRKLSPHMGRFKSFAKPNIGASPTNPDSRSSN